MEFVDNYQIETCNPCGEQPLIKNGACCLASINLSEFVIDPYMGIRGGCHFNPRSPCGERLPRLALSASAALFQSTLPSRGATQIDILNQAVVPFQSTLPSRGATIILPALEATAQFQPMFPLAGSDICSSPTAVAVWRFQSTLPCGERSACSSSKGLCEVFNPCFPSREDSGQAGTVPPCEGLG